MTVAVGNYCITGTDWKRAVLTAKSQRTPESALFNQHSHLKGRILLQFSCATYTVVLPKDDNAEQKSEIPGSEYPLLGNAVQWQHED